MKVQTLAVALLVLCLCSPASAKRDADPVLRYIEKIGSVVSVKKSEHGFKIIANCDGPTTDEFCRYLVLYKAGAVASDNGFGSIAIVKQKASRIYQFGHPINKYFLIIIELIKDDGAAQNAGPDGAVYLTAAAAKEGLLRWEEAYGWDYDRSARN